MYGKRINQEMHDTLKMLEELAALRDLLAHGPDGGAGADMLAIAHRADFLARGLYEARRRR